MAQENKDPRKPDAPQEQAPAVADKQSIQSSKIEIVDTLRGKAMPIPLVFGGRKEDVVYDYMLDQYGFPHYQVSYAHATELLANRGGRIYRLVSPSKVRVKIRNVNFQTEDTTIIAHEPMLVDGKMQWVEKRNIA
jgi:hypothetical protein